MEAEQLMQEIFNIARKLDEIKVFHNVLPFNNTELQMMKVIALADEAGEKVISSDIARSIGITRSAVSQMVKKLEDKNVVVRQPSEDDKKSAHVILSPGARAAYRCIKEYINAFVQQIVDRVGYEEIRCFIDGMNKFIDIFKEVQSSFPSIDSAELTREMERQEAEAAEQKEA